MPLHSASGHGGGLSNWKAKKCQSNCANEYFNAVGIENLSLRSLLGLCHHPATVARNLSFFLGGDNLNFVFGDPKLFKAVCRRGSNAIAVLPDAACKDEKIDTAQQGEVRADHLAHGDSKDIQRQNCIRVIAAGTLFQSLNVAFIA